MLVLSSPSGAGKTTLSRRLLESDRDITLSVSATTRARRPTEKEGADYYFVAPEAFERMVGAGEQTGKIDAMLEKMADFWDEEIEAILNALTSLIEPLLIVFLGVIVGGIVIAMFLPIFKLNDVVSSSKA